MEIGRLLEIVCWGCTYYVIPTCVQEYYDRLSGIEGYFVTSDGAGHEHLHIEGLFSWRNITSIRVV